MRPWGLCVSWVSVSADSEANCSYTNLHTYPMLLDHHIVVIESNEIIHIFLKLNNLVLKFLFSELRFNKPN